MAKGGGKGGAGRAWMVSTLLLLVLTLAAAGVIGYLAYDRYSTSGQDSSSSDLSDPQAFSNFLRTAEEQQEFERQYTAAQQDLVRVTDIIEQDFPCLTDCGGQNSKLGCIKGGPSTFETRRKREVDEVGTAMRRYARGEPGRSGDSSCCPTTTGFLSPDYAVNIAGTRKKLYHESQRRQHVVEISCSQVRGCYDCQCYQEHEVTPLVVDDDGKLSIDYFKFSSCCKCMFFLNTWSNS